MASSASGAALNEGVPIEEKKRNEVLSALGKIAKDVLGNSSESSNGQKTVSFPNEETLEKQIRDDANALISSLENTVPAPKPSAEVITDRETNNTPIKSDDSWKEGYLRAQKKVLSRSQENFEKKSDSCRQSFSGNISDISLALKKSQDSGVAARLTPEQQLMLLSMRSINIDNKSNRNKMRRKSNSSLSIPHPEKAEEKIVHSARTLRTSMDQLCRSNRDYKKSEEDKQDPSTKFGLYDEATNCTFKPKLIYNPNLEINRRTDQEAKSSFIDRQDGIERARREDLMFEIGKKDYDALLNKKYCPNCGGYQSYDEFKERKKKCQKCNIEYRSKLTWGQVEKKFLKKEKDFVKRIHDHREHLIQEIDKEQTTMTLKSFDSDTGKIVNVQKSCREQEIKWNDSIGEEFFARMEEKLSKREEKLKKLHKLVHEDPYTHQPHLPSSGKHHHGKDDDENWSDEENEEERKRNAVKRFLNRMETDLENRRVAAPVVERKESSLTDRNFKF